MTRLLERLRPRRPRPLPAPAAATPWTCRTFGHDPRLTDPTRCLDCTLTLEAPRG